MKNRIIKNWKKTSKKLHCSAKSIMFYMMLSNIECHRGHQYWALRQGCAVVAKFCLLLADSADVVRQRSLMTRHSGAAALPVQSCTVLLHNFARSKEHFMDGARRGRVTPASVVLSSSTLHPVPHFVSSTAVHADMHISAWNDCFTPSRATYKGERESDPLSSLLTSQQHAVKGGERFESMGVVGDRV